MIKAPKSRCWTAPVRGCRVTSARPTSTDSDDSRERRTPRPAGPKWGEDPGTRAGAASSETVAGSRGEPINPRTTVEQESPEDSFRGTNHASADAGPASADVIARPFAPSVAVPGSSPHEPLARPSGAAPSFSAESALLPLTVS